MAPTRSRPAASTAPAATAKAAGRRRKPATNTTALAPETSVSSSAVGRPEVLDLSEAAALLRLPVDQVRTLAEAGRLPGRRIGGDVRGWRFLRSALELWLVVGDDVAVIWWMMRRSRSGDGAATAVSGTGAGFLEPTAKAAPGTAERIRAVVGAWKDDETVGELSAFIRRNRLPPADRGDG